MTSSKYYRFFFVAFTTVCLYIAYFGFSGKNELQEISDDTEALTIHVNRGRLGNQMFTYATLCGLSRLNKRKMQMMPKNYDVLSEYFDIHTPLINEASFVEKNPWLILSWLRDEDHRIPVDSNIIKGNAYPNSYTFFHHIHREVREVFHFKPSFVKHAQDLLWEFKRQKYHTQVYVGVHVRRGDYLNNSRGGGGWLKHRNGREVDMAYFKKAVEHFTTKFENVTFLAVSDDREWCKTNLSPLGILTVPDSPSPGHDMALLAECNHTIMTYGTFGFWGGYLAGGEVVYFSDFLKPNTTYRKDYFKYNKMYLPEWKGISTTETGFWETYSTSENTR